METSGIEVAKEVKEAIPKVVHSPKVKQQTRVLHQQFEQDAQVPEQTEVDEVVSRRELSAEEVAAIAERRREARAAVCQMEKEMTELG